MTRITIIHCRVDQVSDTSATGLLLVKTVGPYNYTDDYERDFQFTLSVENGAWKISQIARCLAFSRHTALANSRSFGNPLVRSIDCFL